MKCGVRFSTPFALTVAGQIKAQIERSLVFDQETVEGGPETGVLSYPDALKSPTELKLRRSMLEAAVEAQTGLKGQTLFRKYDQDPWMPIDEILASLNQALDKDEVLIALDQALDEKVEAYQP